jgi:hypothetical protein
MVGSSTRLGQRTLLEHAAIQAADEIERLQHQMERFAVALDDISHLTTDHQVQHRIKEACRG